MSGDSWKDPDEERQEEHLRTYLENERKQIMFASVVRLMDTLLRTRPYSADEARANAVRLIRDIEREFWGS